MLDKAKFLNGGGSRARHERMRDLDLPAAWLTRLLMLAGTGLISLLLWIANDKLSSLTKVADQMPWVVGTVSGIQTQLNQQQGQITQIYNALLDDRKRPQ